MKKAITKTILICILFNFSVGLYSQCIPTAKYSFDGNALDLSGNNLHGQVFGATLTDDANGNPNSAYLFDGVDDYMELNNNDAILTSNIFTISAWAKMDGRAGGVNHNNTIFLQRDHPAGPGHSGVLIHTENGAYNASFNFRASAGSTDFLSVPTYGYGDFHHYLGVLDKNSAKFYIDGVLQVELIHSQAGDFNTSIDYVYVGRNRHENTHTGFFNGVIDELELYNCALNSNQIWNLYRSSPFSCAKIQGIRTTDIQLTSATLNWSPPFRANHYQIRGNVVGVPGFIYLNIPDSAANNFIVNGLTPNTSYFWQIKSFCDSVGTWSSVWSSPDTFTAQCKLPDTTYTLVIDPNSAVLNWPAVPGATGYKLKGRIAGGSWISLNVNGGNTHSFLTNILSPGTLYEWKVKTKCASGYHSDYTSLTSFTTPLLKTAGDRDNSNDIELSIIPNPTRNFARAKLTNGAGFHGTILIRDVSGKTFVQNSTPTVDEYIIDCSILPDGLYFVEVLDEKSRHAAKVVVKR